MTRAASSSRTATPTTTVERRSPAGTTASSRGSRWISTIQDNVIDTCGEHGVYVSNAADNPSILRNKISNTGANCIQINADLSTGGDGLISNWRIEGNLVQDCEGAAAINLDGAINGVARNNVIYNAAGGGFTLFEGDGAEASHDNLIVNNTVYNPNGTRSAIQIADGADNNVVFNNIFIAQETGFEIQIIANLLHDYNIVSSYEGGSAAGHESTLSVANAAALFADASQGDLRLAADSAAIDKGAARFGGVSAPDLDVLGGARPAGAAYDIGAYEYGATPPVTGAGGIGGGSGGAGGNGEPAALAAGRAALEAAATPAARVATAATQAARAGPAAPPATARGREASRELQVQPAVARRPAVLGAAQVPRAGTAAASLAPAGPPRAELAVTATGPGAPLEQPVRGPRTRATPAAAAATRPVTPRQATSPWRLSPRRSRSWRSPRAAVAARSRRGWGDAGPWSSVISTARVIG